MIRLLKQLSVWLLVGTVLLPSFTRPLYAATGTEWVANTVEKFSQIIDNPDIEKESFDSASTVNPQLVIGCQILSCSRVPGSVFHYDRSVIAGLNNVILAMYANPPANTMAFIRDLSYSLGFGTPPAYAQGIGFSGLSSLLPLWKQFRNVAYLLIAIVMVVVGLMVMLRKKIDPKTVVTIQNSIPRIVIALLLVTFSYAIVGILIDLMYVFMALFIRMIIDVGNSGGTNVFQGNEVSTYLQGNLGTAMKGFFAGGFNSIKGILSLIPWYVSTAAVAIPGILAFIFSGLSFKAGILGLGAAPALFFLLIALILLFGVVRLIFMLLDAYVHIIISLLIAPLQLAMAAVPGTDAFGSWIRNLISKLIVFPLTAALILITWLLTSYGSTDQLWAPPLLAPGGASPGGIAGIVGLGMLLGIPSVVASIQKMLKAEPAIPGGVAMIAGPLGTAAGQLINLAYQFSFISSAFRHGKQPPTPYATTIGAGSQGLGGIVRGGGGGGGGGQH